MMKRHIETIAQGLEIPLSTLERWIRQGRIPLQKVGRECRFEMASLTRWARHHHLTFSLPDAEGESAPVPARETLQESIVRGGVHHHVEGNDIETSLRAAVSRMDALPEADGDQLFHRLHEREQLTSTGVGKGVAIPHPRTHKPDLFPESVIAPCFLDSPVDFRAVDDRPVFILFILISPSVKQHLHLLSRLSYCVRDDDFVRFLRTAPAAETLLTEITRIEAILDGTAAT